MSRHRFKKKIDLFLTKKRERKAWRKRMRLKILRMSKARARLHRETKAGFFGSHSVIGKMLSKTARGDIHMPQTSLRVSVPKTFSMLEDPEGVLELVSSFALTQQNRSISDIYVNFEKVVSQDLGAHALLDKLVDEIVAQVAFKKGRISWKGNFPEDPAKRRFIKAMGIIRQLGLTHRYLDAVEANHIHLFERRCRHYVREMKPVKPEDKTAQSNAAERFIVHVNKCLAKEGRELTPGGRLKLCDYVVEVIDNAENHAGMIDWTIQGYVDMAMEEPACEIVIFNFGRSIAESLDALPSDSYTMQEQVKPYLDFHGASGWLNHHWRREDLLTLIALQGSVSSLNESIEGTRGQGTADLIESFQAMDDERSIDGESPASMYIISGGTRILFDRKYRLFRGEGDTRKIAFNRENDLRKPPDPGCVMPLKNGQRLPGTLIGIKFKVRSGIVRQTEK